MAAPNISVQVAFTQPPMSVPTVYTDITPYVTGFQLQRGRSYELDEIEAGTATVNLDNSDGRFTPGRAASPYYPNVKPRRAISFSVNGNSAFCGFVETWPARFDSLLGTADMTVVDGFGMLGTTNLKTPLIEYHKSTRPKIYYPLTEGSDATSAADIMGNNRPAVIQISRNGGAAAFGGAQLPTYGDQGGASFEVTTSDGDGVGAVLNVKDPSDKALFDLSAFAVSMFYQGTRPTAAIGVTRLVEITGIAGVDGSTSYPYGVRELFSISVSPTGQLIVSQFAGNGDYSPAILISAANVIPDNGAPVHIMIQRTHDTQGTLGHLMAFVNGRMVGDMGNLTDSLPNGAARSVREIRIGGYMTPEVNWAGTAAKFSHVAFWSGDDMPSILDNGAAFWKITQMAFGTDPAGFADRSETTRMNDILDYAGWPAAWRAGLSNWINPSTPSGQNVSTLAPADWATDTTALEVLKKAATDAGGVVFVNRNGFVEYRNRLSRISVGPTWDIASFAEMQYEPGILFESDEQKITNDVTATRPNGSTVTVKDAASVTEYGRKSLTLDIGVYTDLEAADAAGWRLYRYKDAQIRCDTVVIKPSVQGDPTAAYAKITAAEVGNKLKVWELPDAGPFTQAEFFLEGIQHTVTIAGEVPDWTTTLTLSPATNTDACVLDDPLLATLDDTAILTY